MAKIAGVDGCYNGWFVVSHDTDKGGFEPNIVVEFKEVLELCHDFEVITVDMPIGLLSYAQHGGRTCDREARKLLKAPRASSVFSPPVREVLQRLKQSRGTLTYKEANEINRASSDEHIGISRQCFGILPKILEVDSFMTSDRQNIIKEIHPELCFYEMNKNKVAAAHKKSKCDGIKERLELLQIEWIPDIDIEIINEVKNKYKVKKDDVLDAYAALWTAKRIFEGKAVRIPTDHVRDSHGLRMEMWR